MIPFGKISSHDGTKESMTSVPFFFSPFSSPRDQSSPRSCAGPSSLGDDGHAGPGSTSPGRRCSCAPWWPRLPAPSAAPTRAPAIELVPRWPRLPQQRRHSKWPAPQRWSPSWLLGRPRLAQLRRHHPAQRRDLALRPLLLHASLLASLGATWRCMYAGSHWWQVKLG